MIKRDESDKWIEYYCPKCHSLKTVMRVDPKATGPFFE